MKRSDSGLPYDDHDVAWFLRWTRICESAWSTDW